MKRTDACRDEVKLAWGGTRKSKVQTMRRRERERRVGSLSRAPP
jgi:hypothetical protein